MAKVYSQDLRERVIGAVEADSSAREAARMFRVSPSTAIKWVQHWRRTGRVPEAKPRKRYRWRLDSHQDWLLNLVAAEPDLTLLEIEARLGDERGARTCINSLWRFFDRHQVVVKKKRAGRRAGKTRRRGRAAPLAGQSAPS